MKAQSRSLCWWPVILEISCEVFVKYIATMFCYHSTSVHPWQWASGPWERIHLDCVEMNKQIITVVIDAFASWPEVINNAYHYNQQSYSLSV